MLEAIAALVALLLACVAGIWVQSVKIRDLQRNTAVAVAQAKLQGKRVIVEADRRAAVEAAADVHVAAISGAKAEHAAILAELDAERAAIDEDDSAGAAAAALRRAFER